MVASDNGCTAEDAGTSGGKTIRIARKGKKAGGPEEYTERIRDDVDLAVTVVNSLRTNIMTTSIFSASPAWNKYTRKHLGQALQRSLDDLHGGSAGDDNEAGMSQEEPEEESEVVYAGRADYSDE